MLKKRELIGGHTNSGCILKNEKKYKNIWMMSPETFFVCVYIYIYVQNLSVFILFALISFIKIKKLISTNSAILINFVKRKNFSSIAQFIKANNAMLVNFVLYA